MPSFGNGFGEVVARASDTRFDQPHWYACHTRSRHEKSVEALLCRQRVESYLPTTLRESRWKDRTKLILFPLFPGYVFARFTLHQLAQVLSTRGVAAVVGARGCPTPIPASEIESVRLVTNALGRHASDLESAPMVEGSRVRVTAGPFHGVEGVVVERRGQRRVRVGIAAIGQGLEVDIGVADVIPIPARS
ncbi:UpxY family transcription antiterminator [Longimicrobium sp.]|uniref:UpxY family transcription antiterminator n=1 Tax=Longimicrobium sp. TaxID=2029185 RepID=UPI002E35781B|nr:UpxY family transcription antiterminator [Longimicrobium sp.]HEX6037033.1 UpxY family transcription antiterminator [Longimicrobium sp.]